METVEDSFSVKLGDEKAAFVFQAPQSQEDAANDMVTVCCSP